VIITNRLKKVLVNSLGWATKKYLPREVVFLIDILIAFIAANVTFFLISTISGDFYNPFVYQWQIFAIVGIQALFFFIFKSFYGVVRYSGFQDVFNQLKVTALCVFTILIFNEIYYFAAEEVLILDAGVVVFGCITFSMLFFFRVVVKRAYEIMNSSETRSTAYILGTECDDIAMAQGLSSKADDQFKIIGFITQNLDNMRPRILNLPIFTIKQIKELNNQGDGVIISDKKLEELKKADSKIIGTLLELKLKLFKLPQLQDWDENASLPKFKEVKIEDLLQRTPIKIDNQKLSNIYQDKIIIVTGAAGSIGSEIIRQLIPFKPKKLILVDQGETPLHTMSLEIDKRWPEIDYEKVVANVRLKKRMKELFEFYKPEVVFHGAAYKHVPMMESNPIEALSTNFQGTRNLTELAVDFNIERFVFVSTDKAVNPTNIMGASKRAAEIYIQYLANKPGQKTSFITTRFGNVLGSNGSVIPYFKKQIAEGGPVSVTHPEITRYFMTIDEACQLVLEAGGMGKGGEIYVFDMGSPIKIIDLAHHMIRLSGFIPEEEISIEFTGLRPGEKLYEELLADKELAQPTYHDKIMVAKASFNYKPEQEELLMKLLKKIKSNCREESIGHLRELVPEFQPEKSQAKPKKVYAKSV
jgi:FlaA1/EpsC-like NDP-sugar epimerase